MADRIRLPQSDPGDASPGSDLRLGTGREQRAEAAEPQHRSSSNPRFVIRNPQSEDERWMALALDEARAAAVIGEVPVGAVIVRGGELVSRSHNLTHTNQDPSAHAEMVAIRAAARATGHWRLLGCTLYVTLEPCAMCAGAVVLARIPRLVFGAADPKAGMCGSLANLVRDDRLNHSVALVSGVCAGEAGDLLREFFRARRRR